MSNSPTLFEVECENDFIELRGIRYDGLLAQKLSKVFRVDEKREDVLSCLVDRWRGEARARSVLAESPAHGGKHLT
jgi:hypothetical protein